MLILTESGLNLHEKSVISVKKQFEALCVVVYLTDEENLSNPSETSLYFIIFYVLELEFVMTKS